MSQRIKGKFDAEKRIFVITVIVTLMIWFFWGNKELQQKVKGKNSDNEATLLIQSNKSKTVKDEGGTEQKNPKPIESSKPEKDLSCYQRFALEPEWREIEKVFKAIYVDISYWDRGRKHVYKPSS